MPAAAKTSDHIVTTVDGFTAEFGLAVVAFSLSFEFASSVEQILLRL